MATEQEKIELRLLISEAETALHKLMLGDKEVRVGFGSGRQTTWNEVKLPELRAYITDLKARLAALEGRRGRGPIYPVVTAR